MEIIYTKREGIINKGKEKKERALLYNNLRYSQVGRGGTGEKGLSGAEQLKGAVMEPEGHCAASAVVSTPPVPVSSNNDLDISKAEPTAEPHTERLAGGLFCGKKERVEPMGAARSRGVLDLSRRKEAG